MTISTTISASDTGGSGVNTTQYGWSTSSTTGPSSWTNFTSGKAFNSNVSGGNNYLWAKVTDKAGNTTTKCSSVFTVRYEVKYNANGGSSTPATQYKTHGQTLKLQPAISKTGYTFAGWNTNSSGTGTNYSAGGNYTTNASVTLYAKWTANTYTVKYNGNGATGGSTASSTHTYGVAKTLTANGFTRQYAVTYNYNGSGAANTSATAKYSFKNWNTNAAGTGTSYSNGQSVTNLTSTAGGTVNLYAQWNKGSVTLPTPTRTNYLFTGWNTKQDGTGTTYAGGSTYTPTANTTLYAQWKLNSHTVTYNYSENGGTSATKTSATVNEGANIDLTPTATKSGYTFVGWNTNKDATTGLTTLKMGSSNVTVYAIYKKTITGTFYYYNNQKTTVSGTAYNKATSATIKTPTIANVTVNGGTGTARGWSTSTGANATINVSSGANVTLSSNATYYASYSYTVTATYRYNNTSTNKTGTAYMNYAGTKVGVKRVYRKVCVNFKLLMIIF